MSHDEQAHYDREFVGIVLTDYWRTQVAPLLRAWKPFLDAINGPEAK